MTPITTWRPSSNQKASISISPARAKFGIAANTESAAAQMAADKPADFFMAQFFLAASFAFSSVASFAGLAASATSFRAFRNASMPPR